MSDAIDRQSIGARPARECSNGKDICTEISWVDVRTKSREGFRFMDRALRLHSHILDVHFDRRLLFGLAGNNPRSAKKGGPMANFDSQAEKSCRSGNTSWRCHVESGDASRIANPTPAIAGHCGGLVFRSLRKGQAMVEFAFLIPIFLVLIGATISFGLFFFQANVLQQAVDVAAQEISRMPFEPNQELGLGQLDQCDEAESVCNDSAFKEQIYDEQYLVIHDAEWGSSTAFGGDFQAYADQLPLLNRLLVPAMIRDNGMTRYPGALVVNNATGEETILIPIVEYRNRADDVGVFPSRIRAAGETILEWVAPVEEIRVDHDEDSGTPREGPFKLSYDVAPALESFQPGMVALRVNYPAQSTTLLNRTNGQVGGTIVIAGDTTLAAGASTGCYSVSAPSPRISPASGVAGSNPNAGLYGLGELEALTRVLRPYRKVMSFQAIYRREVFSNGS